MERRQGERTGAFGPSLAVIAALALGGRLAYLYGARHWRLLGDGFAYRYEAEKLITGHVQGALHPPIWTFLVAIPPAIGLDGRGYQQVLTALIGIATVVMAGLAGRLVFGARVGLIAAGLVAVYPNTWLYEREVLSEPLSMLAIATSIFVVYRFRNEPGTARAIGLGAMVGLMALIRSELIFVSLLVVTPVILSRSSIPWPRRLGWLAMAGITAATLIAPWAIFNSTRYERPVPLSTGLGPAMAAGNCPPTYEGDEVGYYRFGCIVLITDVSPDPSISDTEFRDRALKFMNSNRGRAAQVAAIRVGRVFNVYHPFQQARLETERGTALWVMRSGVLAYWALAPLAIAGAIITRRRKIALYPLLAFPILVVLAVLPTIGSVRYRAPAEISIVLLAAVAIDHLATSWSSRHAPVPATSPATTAAPEDPS